jgi:hypothetical protein
MKFLSFLFFIVLIQFPVLSTAQVTYRWLDVGSFHNFYSNIGSEIEEGFISEQQGGWQWPAIYKAQDAQAYKGLWLGVENYTDSAGAVFERRVVHIGPRVNGDGEFFPVSIKTRGRFSKPTVTVENRISQKRSTIIEEIDPLLKADREIVTVTNSLIGITVKRTIKQFSQQYHDNYHIIEYIFTNTGNTDGDAEIELPNTTVEGFVPYFLNRMAPVKASRYTIGNGTGWGMNTMNDRRGDGLRPTETETFRAQFAWHGYYPYSDVDYDNIGAPIYEPVTTGGYLSADDTTGRLEAYHFVGTVTLHADVSANDDNDDPSQPFTMAEERNDDALYSNNSAFNANKMAAEYNMMTKGRSSTRHAFQVEPTGDNGFMEPSNDPSLGDAGGFGYRYGYGPYTLAPGESVRIVIAEASSGISRDVAEQVGRGFKEDVLDPNSGEYELIEATVNGQTLSMTKNQWVFTGRDSLFQTFNRAIKNFESGYNIYNGPQPVSEFNVDMASVGVDLSWEYEQSESDISGFEIYRTQGMYDSTYTLLYTADPDEREINDNMDNRNISPEKFFSEAPVSGTEYFYYIVTIDKSANSDSTGNTPIGSVLKSSRYYSQTYDPVYVITSTGIEDGDDIPSKIVLNQNYPNPFNPTTKITYSLPWGTDITLTIYNSLGQVIEVIDSGFKKPGLHSVSWDGRNKASGLYFYRLETSNSISTKKLMLIK